MYVFTKGYKTLTMIQEQMLDVRRQATGQNYLRYWVASQKNVQLWTQLWTAT